MFKFSNIRKKKLFKNKKQILKYRTKLILPVFLLLLIIFVVLNIQKTQSSPDLELGLVGYWPLNIDNYSGTTVYDLGPNSNHGTNNGAVFTSDRFLRSSQAMGFNGSSNYVDMGDVLNIGLDDVTISAWIKKDSLSSSGFIISKSRAASQEHRYWVNVNTGGLVRFATSWGQGGHIDYLSSSVIKEKFWHHILITIKRDGLLQIYLDGVIDNTYDISAHSNVNMVSNNPFRIGSYTASDNITPSGFFDGLIDDVRIYNRVLSEEEITLLYQETNPDLEGYEIIAFTDVGSHTWTVPEGVSAVDVLVVGGGGGGGGHAYAGGGGGGGVIYEKYEVSSGENIPVTVGEGGAAGARYIRGGNGGNSKFGDLLAIGGGGGGSQDTNPRVTAASDGGSGGGSSMYHDHYNYSGTGIGHGIQSNYNVVSNTDLDTGWSKNYQTDIIFNEIPPPDGVDAPTVGHNRGHSAGYWYSYGDYAPKVPGLTYTVSMYVKTLDSNFRIRYYTADNSETGRVWGEYITVPNDGNWHRVVWDSFVNPLNSESDSLSFNFSYDGAIGSSSTRTWFSAPQMEPNNEATPFNVNRGFGNNGGAGFSNRSSASAYPGGGGGGAGAIGHNGVSGKAGDGGDGLFFGDKFGIHYGENGWFAGGGGGGVRDNGVIGFGGKGGGANGEIWSAMAPAGLANTGGGGGGGTPGITSGGTNNGGSGIVIIRYKLDIKVEIEEDTFIEAFYGYGADSWTVPERVSEVDVLVVAGGGGGGGVIGGGGGAGGLIFENNYSVSPGSSIDISIGSGGIGGTGWNTETQDGKPGENSIFGDLIAIGGGGGAHYGGNTSSTQIDGGSGGGACNGNGPGQGFSLQGNNGGIHGSSNNGGGGGGYFEVGKDASNGNYAGDGGDGGYFGDIFGDQYGENGWFAGGGGGGTRTGNGIAGNGGVGGGGNGSVETVIAKSALANTGGGGGGAGYHEPNPNILGGSGGSGIVIIKYTISGGDCEIWGQVIEDGDSITAYQSPAVPFGESCVPETRVCNNEELSGSYSFNSCIVEAERVIGSFGSPARSGLIAHYTLNQNRYNPNTNRVTDNTPYNNHGFANNISFSSDRHGSPNKAMSFNGVNSRVAINYTNPIYETSVFAWFKRNGTPAGGYHIITGGANVEISIPDSTGEIRTGVTTNTQGRQVFNSGSGLVDGNWHSVAMTYDGSNLRSYINGQLTATNPVSGNLSGIAQEIGRYLSDDYVTNGDIDDIRIYNRALSPNEISKLHDIYRPRFTPIMQGGLILDIPLTSMYTKNETIGSEILTDRTPYENDGQNHGATLSNEGASFNGSSDYIEIDDSDLFKQNFNQLSFSYWFKVNSFTGDYQAHIHRADNDTIGSSVWWSGLDNNNRITATIGAKDGSWSDGGTNITPTLNKWYHIVAAWDGSIVRVYVDGNEVHNYNLSSLTNTDCYFAIGQMHPSLPGSRTYYTNSTIKNLRIYNKDLSASEVELLYNVSR